jgi:hypothetical protein
MLLVGVNALKGGLLLKQTVLSGPRRCPPPTVVGGAPRGSVGGKMTLTFIDCVLSCDAAREKLKSSINRATVRVLRQARDFWQRILINFSLSNIKAYALT